MRNHTKKITFFFTTLAFIFAGSALTGHTLFPVPVCSLAESALTPMPGDNIHVGLKSTSALVPVDNGYMRVYYAREKIGIEYYDENLNIQSRRFLDMELSLWGGFFAGSDAYYIVEGQLNLAEDNAAEVLRVIQYDTSWNRTGAASITGNPEIPYGEVRIPFDYGCVEMAEHDGILYIVTGHSGYVDPLYGQGHQGYLMAAVNEASMTGEIADADLWHSFAQHIGKKDSDIYVLEQSEGSRYTKLSRYHTKDMEKESVPVFEYGGSSATAWAIPCYASVDDMALSSANALCIGTSIDQSKYDSVTSDTPHNIYLTVTPMANFTKEATKTIWLTSHNGDGKCFNGVKLTKINDDRFMVSWEEHDESERQAADENDTLSENTLHYIFIDGEGNTVGSGFSAAATISDCHPVVKESKIIYYASNANMVNFYIIDAQTGSFEKRSFRTLGENVSWELKDGVLAISGTGAVLPDEKEYARSAISKTSRFTVTYSGDHAWNPIRNKVEKILVGSGVTEIPDNEFEFFENLTEAEIQEGLTSIGKQAFYKCGSLKKITIPASVTSIGDECFSGAVIFTPEGSYAEKYAQENGILCNQEANDTNEDEWTSLFSAEVKGIKHTYVYTGKAIQPKPTVYLGGKKLKEGQDYTVSYKNNINTGKAAVKVKGKGSYDSTAYENFYIVPKKPAITKLVSPKKNKIKVSWTKDDQASGYEIQSAANNGPLTPRAVLMSDNGPLTPRAVLMSDKKFTKYKYSEIIPKKKITSKTFTFFIRQKYFFRIRAYKSVKGEKFYGPWSKVKGIKNYHHIKHGSK